MTKSEPHDSLDHLGPPAWTNWHRFIDDPGSHQGLHAVETNLYSDTRLTGSLELRENWGYSQDGGPYRVLHAYGNGGPCDDGMVHPRYIFRAMLVPEGKNWPKVVEGIDIEHEVAALLTLETGVRIHTGSRTRYINPEDPVGSPRGELLHPGQVQRGSSWHWLVPGLEMLSGVHQCALFVTYLKLSKPSAVALTRASMSYSSALWICESQPELAWLLFVTALECIAATVPLRTSDTAPALPVELDSVMAALPNDQREILTSYIQERTFSTRKFLELLQRFLPAAPMQRLHHEPTRPSEGRLDWDWSRMKPLLKRVYDMRSKRLHAGVHFPVWMCDAPRKTSDGQFVWEYSERPKNVRCPGSPDLTLNTFAYITRMTILNWWRAEVTDDNNMQA